MKTTHLVPLYLAATLVASTASARAVRQRRTAFQRVRFLLIHSVSSRWPTPRHQGVNVLKRNN
jgi:hypothetical protein